MEPAQLTKLVRGELDWIVMKALEKDRNRRYESASAFAADVQRYLHDEPVLACPPSAWYRFRKFTRRYKTEQVVAGLILFCMASVGGGVGWVARDRTARQVEAANELERALDRAEHLQGQGQEAEALAALDRAELLAGQAFPDPARDGRLAAVQERLAAAKRDQQFLARFEAIRLEVESQFHEREGRFVEEAAFPEIQEALGQYGIAVGVAAPAETAALVQGRPEPVRRGLVAALDECLQWAPRGDVRQWLLATLEAADGDAWRVRVRKALEDRAWRTLESLAREVDVRTQAPSFLLIVGRRFPMEMKSTRLELLRRVQRAYPADLWANHSLAYHLMVDNGQPAEAIPYFTAALALRPGNAGIYVNRGRAWFDAGEMDAAIADSQQALALAPQYAEAHMNLGNALAEKGRLDEAIAEHREAIWLKKDLPLAHKNLGNALALKGMLDEAIAEHREALRLKPDYPGAHYSLGNALALKGMLDEAIAEYREAIRLKKDFPEAHSDLGIALAEKGQLDEAITEFREALRLKMDLPEPHGNLGNALRVKGLLDEAVAEYREALRLKPGDAEFHNNLGTALQDKGLREEAIAEYREALRLQKGLSLAHYNLGNALKKKGLREEAIAEYREALRLKPDYGEAHYGLGLALLEQGRFSDAVSAIRRALEFGSHTPGWRPPAQMLRKAERLAEEDGRLSAVLEGKADPKDAAECLVFARLCQEHHKRYAAAARYYEEAFAAQPALAEDLASDDRYNAACAAALAGCGEGQDAAGLDDEERARLRRQALDWLRADLTAWGRLLDRDAGKLSRAIEVLQHWLADPDFAGVRGPEALAKLPEAERRGWQQLWYQVADILAQALSKSTPEKKTKAK
jgi:tetratricopeptide (TPR) repeat protein